jgi:hypothetical protein
MQGTFRRCQGQYGSRQILVHLKQAAHKVRQALILGLHMVVLILESSQPGTHVVHGLFQYLQTPFRSLWRKLHRFGGGTWLRSALFGEVVFAVDKRMPTGTPFYFAQTCQVSPFKIAVSMFELPQRRVWAAGMEDVPLCVMVSHEPILNRLVRTYLCEIHTCSVVGQMRIYSCV